MKRFVIGDIHGRIDALKEVLKASKFNYHNDKLIVLGDIVDGGPDAFLVIEELIQIENLVFVIGNHDRWFMNYLRKGDAPELWVQQGGQVTIESYKGTVGMRNAIHDTRDVKDLIVPTTHQEFLNRGVYYHEEDNMVFVHGGFNPTLPIEYQRDVNLCWDRELIDFAIGHKIEGWEKVFVGHSTTLCFGTTLPRQRNNLWMMDTGAGHCGKLTIMNVDTEEYWQSKIQPSCR